MDYIDVDSARDLPGLRLVLNQRVPAPWGEAAKAIFRLQQISFTAVAQHSGEDNPELFAWTGHRNAPIALYNNEAPRARWLEIVELAERLGKGPSLLPQRMEERISATGLTQEIAGENGFAWNGRLIMLAALREARGNSVTGSPMFRAYDRGIDDLPTAITKVEEFLQFLTEKIKAQRAIGSNYLVGAQLTIADVYWAYFSQLLNALPASQCPAADNVRAFWSALPRAIADQDPALIEQRDFIFANYLQLPMEF